MRLPNNTSRTTTAQNHEDESEVPSRQAGLAGFWLRGNHGDRGDDHRQHRSPPPRPLIIAAAARAAPARQLALPRRPIAASASTGWRATMRVIASKPTSLAAVARLQRRNDQQGKNPTGDGKRKHS